MVDGDGAAGQAALTNSIHATVEGPQMSARTSPRLMIQDVTLASICLLFVVLALIPLHALAFLLFPPVHTLPLLAFACPGMTA